MYYSHDNIPSAICDQSKAMTYPKKQKQKTKNKKKRKEAMTL